MAQEAGHGGFFHYQFGPDRLDWTPGQCKLFGIDALRYKLLPRWNALPLLVGLTTPLLGVLSVIIESALRIDRYQVELTIAPLQS